MASSASLPHHASLNPLVWGYPNPGPYPYPNNLLPPPPQEVALPAAPNHAHLPEIETLLVGFWGLIFGLASSINQKIGFGDEFH